MNMPLTQHRTQIYMTSDQYRRVKQVAQRRQVSLATVIRDAVTQYTKKYVPSDHQDTFASAKAEFLKLAGMFRGPKNLARDHDQYWDD